MNFSKAIEENDNENFDEFLKRKQIKIDKGIKATPTLVIIAIGCILMSITMGIVGFEYWLDLKDVPNAIGFWALSIVILIPSCHLTYMLLKLRCKSTQQKGCR